MERPISILVVDDEQIVLDSIKKHLRNESYRVITAKNVHEALAIMDAEKTDIALTDLMMPDIDGLEFLKILQNRQETVIAIMITGYATINSALQAQQLGAFDYIAKPFTRDELRKVVKRAGDMAMALRRSGEELSASVQSGKDKDKITFGLKGIGEHSWFMREEQGTALVGVERPFLYGVGNIQNVYLPSVGDELRQGSVYFQVFSSDLKSDSLLSPLSGIVVSVNDKVISAPNETLQDPYGEGWLIRISPTNFESEIKILGL